MAKHKIDFHSERVEECLNTKEKWSEENFIQQFDKMFSLVNTSLTYDFLCLEAFQKRVLMQEQIRQQLEKVELEKRTLEAEFKRAEMKRKTRQDQLRQAIMLGHKEVNRKQKAVRNRDSKRKQLEDVLFMLPENTKREVLKNLTSANPSKDLASSSEIDITDSNFSSVLASSDTDSDNWFLFPQLNEYGSQMPPRSKVFVRRSSTVYEKPEELAVHESDAKSQCSEPRCRSILDESHVIDGSSMSLRSSLPLTSLSSSNSVCFFTNIVEQLTNRQHNFISQHLILGEKCLSCSTKITCGKKGFKCVDCHAIVHIPCESRVPKPCIPMKPIKVSCCSINDFCTSFAPFVPAVVIHCVLQVEERGLRIAGLYRTPDLNKTFRLLKHELLRNRGMPNLTGVDVNIICELLKDFLACLKPALIPQNVFYYLLKEFGNKKTETITYDAVYNATLSLSRCNKDTLVYLIIHLQNVAKSPPCKMSPRSLSKIFTPILVENYRSELYEEEKRKCGLLEQFIKLPAEFWKCVLIKDL